MPLSIEQIRSALEYNSGTGELIFKPRELAIVARKRAEIANGFHPNHGVDVHQLSREAEIAA